MTYRIFAFCASCIVAGGLSAVEEVDIVQETGIPAFILPAVFEKLKAKDPTGKGMPILFTVTDAEGKPATNQKLKLKHAGGEETLTTNDDARVTVFLNAKNATGLKLILPNGFKAKSDAADNVKITLHKGSGGEVKKLDLDQLTLMSGQNDLNVYASKGFEDTAAKLLDSLAERRGFAMGRYGLKLFDGYGAAIVPEGGSLSIEGKVVIPISVDPESKVMDRSMIWGLTHEWVEGSLVFKSRAYNNDKNLRFVGDGLADLIAYNYCISRADTENVAAEVLGSYRGNLHWLQQKGTKSFDLAKDFPAGDLSGPGGYSASFCFWHRLEEEHGPALIGDFIHWFIGLKKTTVAEVLAKLEELTGEKQNTALAVEGMLETYRGLVPPRPFLGVFLQGLAIGNMQPGGPADKGGVKNGDVITSLNGKNMADVQSFLVALSGLKPGATVLLGVSRKGEDHVLTVKLGSQ